MLFPSFTRFWRAICFKTGFSTMFQAFIVFGQKMASHDVTKTSLSPKVLEQFFAIFRKMIVIFKLGQVLKVWRACGSPDRSYNATKKWGRVTPPPQDAKLML